MVWLSIIILVPFIAAIIVPFLHKVFNQKIHIGWFVLFIPFLIFIYLLTYIPSISAGKTFTYLVQWIPTYDINFELYMDGLSLVFGLLITGIGSLVIFYSIFYLSKEREALHNFYVYLMMFMGAMLGLVFSDNILVIYVFWELTSISSFLLIAYWYQRQRSRYGAQKSMLITIFGGLSMLAGFIMLSIITDTYSMREIATQMDLIHGHELFFPLMILILIGAFTKSAQFPFSIWLPDAMEAPTPISAYLHSATMVKAGIYLVARFTPVFGGTAEWFWLVSGIGILTLLYGSINAVRQTDLKALLAYSTISQLGLIMSLLGIGSAILYFGYNDESSVYAIASLAAVFHLVNHSTFKGSLFMVVGIIDHETGTRDIRKLGGLLSFMPISFTLAVIGSFAMAGLPPFNGFLSKEMFFTAVVNTSQLEIFNMETIGVLFPVIAWIASVFTFVYSMILVFKTFGGKYKPKMLEKPAHEAPLGMLIPPAILASLVVIFFFFPNVLANYLLKPALASLLPEEVTAVDIEMKISAWHGWNTELFMTIGVVVIGSILYILLKKWIGLYSVYPQSFTLNRLYDSGLAKMESGAKTITDQYMTGSLRAYMIYIFSLLIFVWGGALLLPGAFSIDVSNDAPVSFYEVGIMGSMLAAALTVLFAKSRLTAIIAVGALGYLVAIFFVLFRAPDLALTQLVVETVTTALFLLCFYHLPKFKKEKEKKGIPFKPLNLIISLGVGTVVTLFAIAANSSRMFEPVSSYFEDSYELAGARNIVNAILVDFRGLDTMLEIFVLTIVGLGVYTLIKLRLARREKDEGAE
ncbi:Na+/H+ antiporter subunit A [Bacillus mesophilum]|uniref:Na+/H+ antiporter subunit A n=1 Tax=Bacillus mesophilum TaxID=1071718 RepID=A0A7V7RPG5_9BACI|nr:Na+/H+ antiporter subunit A [Bacillus mesophilum]KAB2334057.1 Na+/H+ antiporter subunit A [Bacillus mesophilum]